MSLSLDYLGTRRRAAAELRRELNGRVVASFGTGVGGLRVRVNATAHGAGPVVAQVNLTVGGRPFRTQAASERPEELADVVIARLARQLTLLSSTRAVRPWPDPLYAVPPAPPATAAITRRKQPILRTLTPDAALRELDAYDYQAYLYIDPQANAEALIYRAGPCGYRMTRAVRGHQSVSLPPLLVADMAAAPVLSLAGALGRLDAFGEDYLFFVDVSSRRGALLYSRYAGGYGLIVPLL